MEILDQNRFSRFIGKSERRLTHFHLLGLFVLAIGVRLLYLKLASDFLGFEQFSHYANDSRLYLLIADHILSGHEMGAYGLLRVGPGYGLLLAVTKFIFGANPIWPIMLNIFLGGLAAVFVYLLAYQLFSSRAVALIAGGFCALSLTSVSISCHILTDQPFFTFHIAALVCFVRGYKSGQVNWYLLAGVLAGYGAYIRPVGQIWPFIFIFLLFVLPLSKIYQTRLDFIKRAGLTGLVMLLMVLGWSARNYAIHDIFIFGTNGALTVRSCLVAQSAEKNWAEGKTIVDYREEWEAEDGDRTVQYRAAYPRAKDRIIKEFKANPLGILQLYVRNVKENMVADNYYAAGQIPQIRGFMLQLNKAVRKWLGFILIVMTLTGLVLMFKRGHLLSAWLLGVTYFSFSIILGASFWQGSRLHYPAEMAWSIVVSYIVVESFIKGRAVWSEWQSVKSAGG